MLELAKGRRHPFRTRIGTSKGELRIVGVHSCFSSVSAGPTDVLTASTSGPGSDYLYI